jgi:hypothetical protein
MAIKLTSKPNTSPIDGDYPYGDIRDRDGLTPGTPVSKEVYADFHQFFERLMDRTSTTHNNLPDNDYNGFQLYEAFIKACTNERLYKRYYVTLFQTGTANPGFPAYTAANDLGSSPQWIRTATGTYRLTLTGAFPDATKILSVIGGMANGAVGELVRTDANNITILTRDASGTLTDGLLQNTTLKIDIYP